MYNHNLFYNFFIDIHPNYLLSQNAFFCTIIIIFIFVSQIYYYATKNNLEMFCL